MEPLPQTAAVRRPFSLEILLCLLFGVGLSVLADDPAQPAAAGTAFSDLPEIEGYASWPWVRGPFTVEPWMAGLCEHPPFVGHPGTTDWDAEVPETSWIRVYANAAAATKLEAGAEGDFASGSVIVKEKLTADDAPAPESLGVAIKRAVGFDPERGDWEFLFLATGERLARGYAELGSCYGCHQRESYAGVEAEDYVFVARYRQARE